jgi:hypothetical protein
MVATTEEIGPDLRFIAQDNGDSGGVITELCRLSLKWRSDVSVGEGSAHCGAEIFKASVRRAPRVIPRHGCIPAEPASVSPSRVIVAPHRDDPE